MRVQARRDPRFNALKKDGERHSVYKKWIVEQKEQDVRDAAAAAETKRRQFSELLDSKASVLAAGAKFSKAELVCFEEPRWQALPAAERQSVYAEWLEGRRRAAHEAERAELDSQVRSISGRPSNQHIGQISQQKMK